jgi:hypothetical protein
LNSDVGLVRVAGDQPFVAVKVASPDYACRRGETVISFGCDHGSDATARVTEIVSIDRYQHAPNLQVAFEPVQGRSGGGLFNSAGELIGVCNAADAEEKQGLFASLKAVHAELDRAKLSFVYRTDGGTGGIGDGRTSLAESTPAAAPVQTFEQLSDEERTLLETLRSPHGAEVICLVRALDDPEAKSRVFQINRASSAFWRELAGGQSDEMFGAKLTSLDHRIRHARSTSKKEPAAGASVAGETPAASADRRHRIWPFRPIGR